MRCCASPQGRAVADEDRRRLTPEHFFRPAAEMRVLFADLPEACDNTLVDRPALRLHPAAAAADPAGFPDPGWAGRGDDAARGRRAPGSMPG